jgi:hypothetical protein
MVRVGMAKSSHAREARGREIKAKHCRKQQRPH